MFFNSSRWRDASKAFICHSDQSSGCLVYTSSQQRPGHAQLPTPDAAAAFCWWHFRVRRAQGHHPPLSNWSPFPWTQLIPRVAGIVTGCNVLVFLGVFWSNSCCFSLQFASQPYCFLTAQGWRSAALHWVWDESGCLQWLWQCLQQLDFNDYSRGQ